MYSLYTYDFNRDIAGVLIKLWRSHMLSIVFTILEYRIALDMLSSLSPHVDVIQS